MAHPALPDLSARQLQCVVLLTRYGSFVAAAADLGMSQPALTRTIQQIEAAVGVRLFTRSTRHVAPTAAGRSFAPVAERLLGEMAVSLRALHDLGRGQQGRVTIATLMSIACGPLPGILAAYRRDHPGVEIELREGVHSVVHEDVRNGFADFGITDLGEVHAALTAEPLREEPFQVVMAKGHRLARRSSLALGDLVGETMIAMPYGAGIRRVIDGAAATEGVTFGQIITVSQFATSFSLIANGLGIAVMPEGVEPVGMRGRLVSRPLVRPKLKRRIGILTLRNRPLSPATASFTALLRRRLAKRR